MEQKSIKNDLIRLTVHHNDQQYQRESAPSNVPHIRKYLKSTPILDNLQRVMIRNQSANLQRERHTQVLESERKKNARRVHDSRVDRGRMQGRGCDAF